MTDMTALMIIIRLQVINAVITINDFTWSRCGGRILTVQRENQTDSTSLTVHRRYISVTFILNALFNHSLWESLYSTFHDNGGRAAAVELGTDGGAVLFEGARLLIDDSSFTANSAVGGNGGAISITNAHNTLSVIIRNCTFINNTQSSSSGATIQGFGGAIAVTGQHASLNVTRSKPSKQQLLPFARRERRISGSVTVADDPFNIRIENCLFSGNSAATTGGAIAAYQWEVSITECTFIDNRAMSLGGALSFESLFGAEIVPSQVDKSDFISNNAGTRGGAASVRFDSIVHWHHCSFFNNRYPFGVIASQGY
jgi:predicted outer membrane repeat protein